MKKIFIQRHCRAQTAIEYLMILTVVAIIVLAGFKYLVPGITNSQSNSQGFFSKVTRVIGGEKPDPINGGWCMDGTKKLTCECPAPAFGGTNCF